MVDDGVIQTRDRKKEKWQIGWQELGTAGIWPLGVDSGEIWALEDRSKTMIICGAHNVLSLQIPLLSAR